MAFAWKASGLTYNRYLSVAARVVRRSLKEGERLKAERRGEMELRFAKWEVSLAWLNERTEIETGLMKLGQNGKQGENKSLAQANTSSMIEASGQGQGQGQ